MRDTIDKAREVKATAYTSRHYLDRTTYTFNPEQLKAFADLVRAHACADEREACMNALRALPYAGSSKYDCMDAIRARGNT